jgi:hypothetical protein
MLISYFSSGFPSHVRVSAIDISNKNSSEEFYSPFEGEIVHLEKFYLGRPNRFAKVNYDYLMIAKVNGKLIKILHVEPFLKVGDTFKKGEMLGKLLENPYTGGDFLHAHIEGIRIRLPKITSYDDRGIGIIVNKTENYFDVKIKSYSAAGKLHGLGCCGGLLNASLPYSGYGGIIGREVDNVKIGGINFYTVKQKRKNLTLFEVKKGLIRNWEYDSTFKVLEGKPIFMKSLFESILSTDFPLVRFYLKTRLSIGDEIDVWEIINGELKV